MRTEASSPGGISFNPLCYWRYRPFFAVLAVGFAMLMVGVWAVLVLSGHKGSIPTKDGGETPIWLFAPASLGTLGFYTWLKARKFQTGDANPGVVVSLVPVLIAVQTDLTKGGGKFPAVKIVRVNLDSSNGEPLQLGTRVSTVSNYFDTAGKGAPHWGDFDPEPAEYSTSRKSSLSRLASSFNKQQYASLAHSLKLISQPYRPAIYAMWSADGKKPGRKIRTKDDF